jgi:hypothetical protein
MPPVKHTEASLSLRERGFDPAAAPAEAVEKLAQLRGAGDDLAMAQALGEIIAPESAALLAQMENGASGILRREIRRSLFRLRSRGIEPAPVSSIERAAPARESAETGLTGLISTYDAEGARVVWLLKSRSAGGVKRIWAIISGQTGLATVAAETLSRKELRSDRAELQRRAGAALIDADWHLADFIMCEAYRRTPEVQRARVGNFLTLRTELVAAAPSVEYRHPIYDEFASEIGREASPDLVKEPEIGSYKLPQDAIKPFAENVAQLRQSTLVLNRMQQEERITTVIDRAVEELLQGDLAYLFRRRLEDSGYYFARTSKRAQAGWAAAAAAHIRDGSELKRIGFFQLFMRAQLGAILAEQQEQQQQEPRLIMTPAEMMRARAAAQARSAQRGRLR